VPKSAAVERWFKTIKPPSEGAMRRLRDVILSADASMSERVQYGVTFSSSKSGDFAAFVRYREPGVNLRLMRGGRLQGQYPHLEGRTVKRMRITNEKEASARAAELKAMVKEWCSLGEAARARRRRGLLPEVSGSMRQAARTQQKTSPSAHHAVRA
jgi:hypothetical protein